MTITRERAILELKCHRNSLIKAINEKEYAVYQMAIDSLETQQSLQEELKKLKAQIEKMPNANPSYSHTVDVVDRYDVLELLEDRIKELSI